MAGKNFQLTAHDSDQRYDFDSRDAAERFIDEHEVAAFELWQLKPRQLVSYGKTPVKICRSAPK